MAYQKSTIKTVQVGLVKLGYDPGPADGAWGGNTRKAANSLRAKHGLPPSNSMSGSTLQLIHRLAPGKYTLPNPGYLIIDVNKRNERLRGDYNLASSACSPFGSGISLYFASKKPVSKVTTWSGRKGYISSNEDWYSPISLSLVQQQGQCVAGDVQACREIVKFLKVYATTNSLKPGFGRRYQAWEDTSWIVNDLLKKMIFSYAVAVKLVDVAILDEMLIVDWLKRRVDQFHYIKPSGKRPGSLYYREASNHAATHMMPAMALGALIGDRAMFESALPTYATILRSMRKDGSLPLETRRGARALHYSHMQIGHLLSMAAMAKAQSITALGKNSNGGTVQRAVKFVLDATENFDRVASYARANHGSPSKDYNIPYMAPWHYGWLAAYRKVHGEDANLRRLKTLYIDDRICSKKARKERKLRNTTICPRFGNRKIPLHKAIEIMGNEASHSMGFDAGCLMGN